MVEYKTSHGFGAAATLEGYLDFEMEYLKLKNSELLNYEEKVENARKSAEDEFREQFLAKLQENMKNAQTEFKELNKALKDIRFSSEQYEFSFMPSKRYRHYYEMIMDDFNAMQGESIFSGLFHENHKEVIDELFERLPVWSCLTRHLTIWMMKGSEESWNSCEDCRFRSLSLHRRTRSNISVPAWSRPCRHILMRVLENTRKFIS